MANTKKTGTLTHVTLAMDLSMSQPGFAVLALTSEGEPIILDKSYVKTNAKKSHGFRLSEINSEIERLLRTNTPTHIVREKAFSRFAQTTMTINKVVGVSDLVAYQVTELPVHEIAVTSVKKHVTGNGKADKAEVARAVIKRLRIDKPHYFANDDESDAVAVGLAYYIEKGMIE